MGSAQPPPAQASLPYVSQAWRLRGRTQEGTTETGGRWDFCSRNQNTHVGWTGVSASRRRDGAFVAMSAQLETPSLQAGCELRFLAGE